MYMYIYIYIYIYPAAIPESKMTVPGKRHTAAPPKMICRVNARRGTIFGRMIEARNWLRRIRVSKWSPGLRGALAFVAIL